MKHLLLSVVVLFIFSTVSAQSLQEGLVFYAPFDGSAVNLVDWVKPVNSGAALAPNKFSEANKAMAFDGENDLLDYGNIVNLGKSNFSVSLWIKVDAFQQGARYGQGVKVINKGLTGEDRNGYRGFGIRAVNFDDSGNNFRFMTADGLHDDDSPILQFTDKFGLEENEWYHLVVTRFGELTQLYLNGELAITGVGEAQADLTTDQSLTLGGLILPNGDASEFFTGLLDEVRIYNRRLSKRDIDLLYQQFIGESNLDEIAVTAPIKSIQISTFPNPATRILNVDFTSEAERRIEVLDGAGRNMSYGRFNGMRAEVNVAGLPPGTYFLKVQEGDKRVIRKFVKQGVVLP